MSQQLTQTDPVVCRCLNVTESAVRDCVVLLGACSVGEVKAACGAGGGCMACRVRIQRIINQPQDAATRLPCP